ILSLPLVILSEAKDLSAIRFFVASLLRMTRGEAPREAGRLFGTAFYNSYSIILFLAFKARKAKFKRSLRTLVLKICPCFQ
ncbi:MAG: hypothetical protein IJG50_03360, partial [Clostridia bacterium]|nr:hypothetical protein [Clostridia bacterium]